MKTLAEIAEMLGVNLNEVEPLPALTVPNLTLDEEEPGKIEENQK